MKSTAEAPIVSYQTEIWFSEVEKLEYSDYWNDEAKEREKIWWVLDGDFSKMESYLAEIAAISQLEACVQAARNHFSRSLQGMGVDLAAGNLWATSHLIRLGAQKVISVEYSRHRLLKLGIFVLEHYGVPPAKVLLALGDFHHIRIPDASLDFVFMSQAFHHSKTPRRLLMEIRRILKPQGFAILTGEHIRRPSLFAYLLQPFKFLASRVFNSNLQKRMLGRVLQNTDLWLGRGDFLERDEILGDHYFTDFQYRRLFKQSGFKFISLRQPHWNSQAFVLVAKILVER